MFHDYINESNNPGLGVISNKYCKSRVILLPVTWICRVIVSRNVDGMLCYHLTTVLHFKYTIL